MDPMLNPFSPGAGSRPPELAGRDDILEDARIALGRTIRGRSSQSQILLGLRGTGKTVLLNAIEGVAEVQHFHTSYIEAQSDNKLAEMLYPLMRQTIQKFSIVEQARSAANRALSALRNFASVFKISHGDIQIEVEPTPGSADTGDLELDLTEMFELVGRAARDAGRGWALLIDEIQYLEGKELAAIIVAIHRVTQKGLPVIVFAAGLPQIAKLSGDAKSYAERLFTYPKIGPLERSAAEEAIRNPLQKEGITIDPKALKIIIDKTNGYPFFLQEWGHQIWNISERSPITVKDAQKASGQAIEQLDQGFFRVRLDRLTGAEQEYVKAMAALGAGPYKSTDVASQVGKDQKTLGPRRAKIIAKGMIYSPGFGEIDFSVPLFDDFLRRQEI